MGRAYLDKLIQDLREDPELLAGLRVRLRDPKRALGWVQAKGYNIDRSELADLAASEEKLSQDEMDRVAGGEDAWRTGPGGR